MKRARPPRRREKKDALTLALRLLSYRARSIEELKGKLESRGIEPVEVKKTIDHLIEAAYLDDEAFARERASSRLRLKNWGKIKIASELSFMGVPPEITRKVVSDIDESEELEAASRALENWIKSRAIGLPLEKELSSKAFRFLLSRGFSSSIAVTAIKHFS